MDNEFKFIEFFSQDHQRIYKSNGGIFLRFTDPPAQSLGRRNIYYSKSTDELRLVDLSDQVCTCVSFQHARKYFERDCTARFCKCLLSVALEHGYCENITPMDEYIQSYTNDIASFKSPHAHFVYRFVDDTGNVTISSSEAGNPWWNVFTRAKVKIDATIRTGRVEKYGYSDRWSHRRHPVGATNIRAKIDKLPTYWLENRETTAIYFSLDALENLLASGCSSSASLRECMRALISHSNSSHEILRGLALAAKYSILPATDITKLYDSAIKNFEINNRPLPDYLKTLIVNLLLGNPISTPIDSLYLLPDFSLASIAETQTRLEHEANLHQRQRLVESISHSAEKDFLADEAIAFNALPESPIKEAAQAILNEPLPDWYSRDKGHTHVGYKYSNFSDKLAKTTLRKSPSEADATILNYFTSLALTDGSMSRVTLARMLYYKGYLAHRQGNVGRALAFLRTSKSISREKKTIELLTRLEFKGSKSI